MNRSQRIVSAVSTALTIIVFAWVLAFWSYVRRHPDRPYRPPPATIDSTPSTLDYRYVASTLDRTQKRYHLPGCSYVRLLKHGREFTTEAEARAAGYEPCSRCLGAKIVRSK